MKFQLLLSCNNAAFGDTPEEALEEVARILEATRRHLLSTYRQDGPVRDANGNNVGSWALLTDGAEG
jgi:hypothetical protein